MTLIAELELELSYSEQRMGVRLHGPERERDDLWFCRFEIDEPLAMDRKIYGVSTMQALVLALKTISINLYGSDLYKRGELGLHGDFGGDLSIPAHSVFLENAPFPF